ncbi:histone deacetylase [Candidatus Sumerlaeota bacterium]|nr:histone deacetylase [Candidatus Sumerlaeota bacterium]
MRLGLVLSSLFERHEMPPGHPERSERTRAVANRLIESGLADKSIPIESQQVTREQMLRIHSERHLAMLESIHRAGGGQIDPDTHMGKHSWPIAMLAAGSAVAAAECVAEGQVDRAFLVVRPPGHHATPDRAMGFCLLNSVSIAARHLLATGRARRVLIVDFDVHHGNGTQQAFWEDPSVVYISTHQWPLFPGTGRREETGQGQGQGTIFNLPHPPNTVPSAIVEEMRATLERVQETLPPDFVFISAGFDGHRADPLADWRLDVGDFVAMTRDTLALANSTAGGRVVSLLEGGYDLDVLADCTEAHVRELMRD